MKHYDALAFYADRPSLELLTAFSTRLPITGVLDNDASIVMYFEDGVVDDALIDEIRSWLPEGSDVDIEREEIEEQNWNAEFERSLEPVWVTDDLVITQSWNPVDGGDALVVTIDPKMSFGTGHHESTRLISRLLMRIDVKGRSVLDVGTGTGALAIIAARRGAERVVAFDNNEWAVDNARENFERNDVVNAIELVQGELADVAMRDVDVIVANLHRNLIIELLPELAKRFGALDRTLLTSGVLISDYDGLIAAAAEQGLRVIEDERENEWVATRFG
ncbi:MAG: 50S ribosomal protein L11 methyltransferase [bacterium]|nr:50S ribosomal protein L11 methyltransferase [Candidatus Kapabacteria bacterium]